MILPMQPRPILARHGLTRLGRRRARRTPTERLYSARYDRCRKIDTRIWEIETRIAIEATWL